MLTCSLTNCVDNTSYGFMRVQPLDMVDKSFSPCERISGRFSLHSAYLIGCFIHSFPTLICSQSH